MRTDRPGQFKRKHYASDSSEAKSEVRLKPIFGIKPGAYLTALYGILILFLLFFVLFYKGLRDQGTFLRVTTFPPGAAINVDGNYAGSSPCEVLVKKGMRRITASKPFFRTEVLEDRFRGPIFGTLIVRPRRKWNLTLEVENFRGLVVQGIQDFSANPHVPEILVDTVLAGYMAQQSSHDDLYDFLDKAKYFISSPIQIRDFIYATSALDANVRILTPTSLLASIEKIIHIKEKYENFPFWLAFILPEEMSKKVTKSDWFADFTTDYISWYSGAMKNVQNQAALASSVGGPSYSVQGVRFHAVPDGSLIQGNAEEKAIAVQLPHPVQIRTFLMGETEVSNRLYRSFLEENPEWRKSNREALQKDGRVTEDYLAGWAKEDYPTGEEALPVTHVSFYAAEAFSRWFTTKLPAFLSGYSARLPTEAEWEWAARGGLAGSSYPMGSKPLTEVFFKPGIQGPRPVGSSSPNGYGLRDMSGNVWEWCSDWYSAVAYLYTSRIAERNPSDLAAVIPYGAEKVVRGGSWANDKELVKVYTRASQPPSWSTPYLGFRIVLSRP